MGLSIKIRAFSVVIGALTFSGLLLGCEVERVLSDYPNHVEEIEFSNDQGENDSSPCEELVSSIDCQNRSDCIALTDNDVAPSDRLADGAELCVSNDDRCLRYGYQGCVSVERFVCEASGGSMGERENSCAPYCGDFESEDSNQDVASCRAFWVGCVCPLGQNFNPEQGCYEDSSCE